MPSQPERVLVYEGKKLKTKGGLTKADLVKNSRGRIVSKKMSELARKRSNLGPLLKKKGESPFTKNEKADKVKPKPKPKKVVNPPKITKLEPTKAGQHKDLSKVSVGNIVRGKRKRKKRTFYG